MDGDNNNVASEAPAGEPYIFSVEEFKEGDFAGMKFNTVEFNTLESAAGQYSPGIALALLNTVLAQRMRAKVKNDIQAMVKKLGVDGTRAKLLAEHPDGVIFSSEDALAWRPEARDVESPTKLFKEGEKLLREGKIAEGMAKLAQAAEAAARKYGLAQEATA